MTVIRSSQPGFLARRYLPAGGFTLIESLAAICILSLMLYVTVGTIESLRSTSRLTAAQNLVNALEQARSDAIRISSASLIAFRQKADEFGVLAYREYGLIERKSSVSGFVWRQLPKGIVLWEGMPKTDFSGTNVLAVASQSPRKLGITGMGKDDDEEFVVLAFGDLGEVTFPTAQPVSPGAPVTPGPYYLCVAEAAQTQADNGPANMQMIEIRAATGRAQLLP